MKLPHTKVKFYPEVKSQTGLSSLWVSCKRALMGVDFICQLPVINYQEITFTFLKRYF